MPAETPSNPELLQRCLQGDEAAWEILMDRFGGLVGATARRFRLPADEVDDVIQESFLALLRHLDRIEDPERIGLWLLKTAEHGALRRHRKRESRREQELKPETLSEPAPPTESLLLELERDRELRDALSRLNERCRQLLEKLYGPEPAGYNEISRLLGIPVGSIGPTRARCLEKLRSEFER